MSMAKRSNSPRAAMRWLRRARRNSTALVGVLDRSTVPVDLNSVLPVTASDRVVHHATARRCEVERLRRTVDHAEVQLPVGDDRLDRAEARWPSRRTVPRRTSPLASKRRRPRRPARGPPPRTPPRRHGPTVEREIAPVIRELLIAQALPARLRRWRSADGSRSPWSTARCPTSTRRVAGWPPPPADDHRRILAAPRRPRRSRPFARGSWRGERAPGAVEDLGAFHSLWFEDPDGMRVELTVLTDPALAGIHEPRPLATAER